MTVEFDIERFESETLQHDLGDYWMRISEQISVLNRFVYLEWASARIVAGWVPAAEEFQWKCALTKMIWQNMTIAERLLDRKQELSSNRTVAIPSQNIHELLQNVSAADGFFPFLAGWFLEVTREQIRGYERLMEVLDPIFDAPTLEMLQECLPKKQQQLKWAVDVIHDAVKESTVLEAVRRWRTYTRQYLHSLGGIDEKQERLGEKPLYPIAEAYGPAPRRRSKPQWLQPGDFLDPPKDFAHTLRIFMWHYATEVQVLDPMCYVFYGVDDMPFEFYVDLSRHIWDESRHHLMGVRRLQQMGYDLKDIPLPYAEDAQKDLEQFYGSLTMFGEACSFNRKRDSMQAYYSRGDIISGMTAEIDITDERSHVRFGKKWLPYLYKLRLGDTSSLEEIRNRLMHAQMATNTQGDFDSLSEEEKEKLSHAAFCGKVEFQYLNFERP